ncbi:MAG: hypothetical protein MRJ68_20170 [Nitrospira sp.]|nr:hypothetical protein [Nitrospira sp.]
MGRKSQREIQRLYLLHRECVRRNPQYGRAYRKVHAIRDPERYAVELGWLSRHWGLSPSEDPPDPAEWPLADLEALLRAYRTGTAASKSALAQLDPVEFDAATQGLDLLRSILPRLAQQMKGFLFLVQFPERPNPPWGVAAIDLRRPKDEVLGVVRDLVDEAWKNRSPRHRERTPMRGSVQKGFAYLRVYDLRIKGQRRLKDIGSLMWPALISQDTEQKAGVYLAKAKAMIAHPPFLRALTQQLQQRQKGRVRYWDDPDRCSPSAMGRSVWLTPTRLSNGQWV